MQKALRVLIVIAIVLCMVQLFDLITDLITELTSTDQPDSASFALAYAKAVLINWLVFWPFGLVTLTVGIFIRKKLSLLGNSLAIGGVYLMLLGNNGGLWASGYEVWRLLTSIISLAILILLAVRLDNQRLPVAHQEIIEGQSVESNKK